VEVGDAVGASTGTAIGLIVSLKSGLLVGWFVISPSDVVGISLPRFNVGLAVG